MRQNATVCVMASFDSIPMGRIEMESPEERIDNLERIVLEIMKHVPARSTSLSSAIVLAIEELKRRHPDV